MPRIIAGEFRGRRLATAADATRPTSDRVREAVASMLGSRMDLQGVRVLDLYAGTGAMALELVSRGAANAVLVEADRKAAAVAKSNIAVCGAQQRVRVAQRSVESFLAMTTESYDLVFLDPPYELPAADFDQIVHAVVPHLAPEAWIVAERGSRGEGVSWPAELDEVATKDYGDTRITLAAY